MAGKFMSASLIALAAAVAPPQMARAAQAGDLMAPSAAPTPAPAAPAAQNPSARFLSDAIPAAHFLEQTSRMAAARTKNSKIRDFAQQTAKAQTAAALSLTAWVNTSGPVVTGRSAIFGQSGASPVSRVTAPRLLQSQADQLQRLSTLQGRDFDAAYISAQRDGLQQLADVYQQYVDKDGDPGLHAIAARELVEVKKAMDLLAGL